MDLPYLKSISPESSPAPDADVDFKTFFNNYKKRKCDRPDVLIMRCLQALEQNRLYGVDISLVEEAVFNAATEVGDLKLAKHYAGVLHAKFQTSVRTGVLQARYKEQEGKYSEALEDYKRLEAKDMSNITIMKRKVCCHRQLGNVSEAVRTLKAILNTYPSDISCWHELYEIYLHHGEYEAAAHCCEEIVMIDAGLAANHCRLADVYYTLGSASNASSSKSASTSASLSASTSAASTSSAATSGPSVGVGALVTGSGDIKELEYLLLARKHYTLALERQGADVNRHGVYGLFAAARAIAVQRTKGDTDKAHKDADADADVAVNNALLDYAAKALQSKHLVC
jgi:tetratricopeptide (TPR) repeat protein